MLIGSSNWSDASRVGELLFADLLAVGDQSRPVVVQHENLLQVGKFVTHLVEHRNVVVGAEPRASIEQDLRPTGARRTRVRSTCRRD